MSWNLPLWTYSTVVLFPCLVSKCLSDKLSLILVRIFSFIAIIIFFIGNAQTLEFIKYISCQSEKNIFYAKVRKIFKNHFFLLLLIIFYLGTFNLFWIIINFNQNMTAVSWTTPKIYSLVPQNPDLYIQSNYIFQHFSKATVDLGKIKISVLLSKEI